jgi:type IV secretory pathway protease TraF
MNLARYRKALTIGLLGLVEVAAYIVADPRELPPWVVTAAAAINTLAVFWVRNARPVTRADLAREVGPTRFAGPEDRRGFGGGP